MKPNNLKYRWMRLLGFASRNPTYAGADLTGADLYAADLRNTILIGANLTNTKLDAAGFEGADLTGADLRGAVLDGTSFDNANLTNVNMLGAVNLLGTTSPQGFVIEGAILCHTIMPDGTIRNDSCASE